MLWPWSIWIQTVQAPWQNAPMSYISIPADVEIHAIYSKFNKVVCVIKMGVLCDTDFNCFFYAIVPPYLTHAVECHVALWLMDPPGGHRTLQWVAAGAKRQLIGHSNMLSSCSSQHVQKNYARNVDVSIKSRKIELENVQSCKKKSIVTKSGCLIAPKKGRCWTWVANKEQTLAIWKPGSCNRWHLHRQYSVAQQQGSRVKHL